MEEDIDMSKDVTIYWAPNDFFQNNDTSWNILYKDIQPLSQYYNKKVFNKKENFLQCPSVTGLMKKTYVIENPIASSFIFENNSIIQKGKTFINSSIVHDPTIENNILFSYGISLVFFSEEEIDMMLTSPYFSNSQHLKYGSIVPGKINIGSWFRKINLEFNLWENNKEITINENEHLAYISFNTEKNIIMKRFYMNETLHKISKATSTSSLWEPRVSLEKRYRRFRQSATKKIVLSEIKKNLIDDA